MEDGGRAEGGDGAGGGGAVKDGGAAVVVTCIDCVWANAKDCVGEAGEVGWVPDVECVAYLVGCAPGRAGTGPDGADGVAPSGQGWGRRSLGRGSSEARREEGAEEGVDEGTGRRVQGWFVAEG